MARATESALSELHNTVAVALSERLKKEDVSAADINAAIKFLKDNNITATPSGSSALDELRDKVEQAGAINEADDAELAAALDNVVQFQKAQGHA